MSAKMRIRDYERLFRGADRAAVSSNWKRARKDRWPVDARIVDSRKQLGKLKSCWTRGGAFGQGGKFMRLADLDLSEVAAENRERVFKIAAAMEAEKRPHVMVIPAIEGPHGVILRDGNHRCAALMVSRVKFSVLVLVVKPKGALWSPDDLL